MIGIDFTFISLDRMNLTGSLEVFTCDILKCIAAQKEEGNFVIIVHQEAENMIRQKFPTFKVYGIGGIFLRILYRVFSKNGINMAKKYKLYYALLKIHGITKIWFPHMLPVNVQGCKCNYIGTCHDLMQMDKKNNDAAYKKAFEGAEQIVTISNYVKNQIVEKYRISPQKIVVIPNSIYFSTNKIPVEAVQELEGKEFLFDCNAFTPRKNTSENEGFGRTPIEAALFLKPVISTRATSLEESTCGMVHYVEDPRNDEELADIIIHTLQNPDGQEQLIKIREAFAQKYSPERIVREYMEVFYKVGWIDPLCDENI